MQRAPTLLQVMSPFPYFIDEQAPIADAAEMMSSHDIHHLPVKGPTGLIGIVADRDIVLARATTLADDTMRVGVICRLNPCVASLHEELAAVVRRMRDQHTDAALVLKEGHLAGIVTMTDIYDALLTFIEPPEPSVA